MKIFTSNHDHAPLKTHIRITGWRNTTKCSGSKAVLSTVLNLEVNTFWIFATHNKNDCYTDFFLYMITCFVKLLMTNMDNKKGSTKISIQCTQPCPRIPLKNNACKLHGSTCTCKYFTLQFVMTKQINVLLLRLKISQNKTTGRCKICKYFLRKI